MKKLSAFLMVGLFVLLIGLSLFEVGCTSVTPMLGNVTQVIVGDDYEAAGKAVGEAGYTAYVILKGNPKYDKYTKKCEELYAALDAADSDVKIGTVNTVAMEVMNAALTVKYGYAKAQYKWYDPRRYWVIKQAAKFAARCEAWGWPAYAAAINERKEAEKAEKQEA